MKIGDALSSLTSKHSGAPLKEELPLERVYHWEQNRGSQTLFTQPMNGAVLNWTWAEAMQESRSMAAYLRAQNWPPESRIVILSRDCAWWVMAELAIWMSGHVTVPLYSSLPVAATRRLFDHCEPVACFLGPVDDAAVVSEISPTITSIRFPNAELPGPGLDWATIVKDTPRLAESPARGADDLATIIYTSGTTGNPKGAMHHFLAFTYFAKAVLRAAGDDEDHRVLSYLPLAHIAERALAETASLYGAWHMFFSENANTFLDDVRRAKPTVFFAVPRIYAKLQEGVIAKLPQEKLEHLLHIPVMNKLTKHRILHNLGLDAVRLAASGAAALPLDVLHWYRELGLPLTEGYGTTEIGISHVPPGGASHPGYVGQSAPGVETKISDQGEVLVKSPMSMIGYYKDPEGTKQVFTDDGFIRTGDLGELDNEGWLKITGRIKDQFKTSKGKFVLPVNMEMMLTVHSAIESCLVMGAGLAAPFAVIVLTGKARETASTAEGRSALEASLKKLLDETNEKVASYERLRFIAIVNTAWTVAREFLTPTQKLRRQVIEKYYAPCVADWEAQDSPIVWHSEN